MAHISHVFMDGSQNITEIGGSIVFDDMCVYCNKYVADLIDFNLFHEITEKFPYHIEGQINEINKHAPCITTEEYMIKMLLE